MLVGTEAEVLESLSGVLGATQEQGVASGRSTESKLVQGQDLTTGSQDTGAGGSGEAESSNAELGDGQETVVVSDGTDDHNGLVVRLLGSVGNNSRDGNGRSVDAGHKEAAQDDLVEGRVGTAYEKISSAPALRDISAEEKTHGQGSGTASRAT